MFHFTRLLSVANLLAAQERLRGSTRLRSVSGQVATFMLLGIVGVLIFVLMTANLGQMSMQATRAANAADSSALLLGSQLASKSKVLWDQMGHKTKKCVKGGMLGLVLAIILIIIVLIVTWGQAWYIVVPIATAAGAVGGAIGTAMTGAGGNAILMGAIQGAILGAALGTGAVAASSWMAAPAAAPTELAAMLAGDMAVTTGGGATAAELSAAVLAGAEAGGATAGAGATVAEVSIMGETVPAATAAGGAAPTAAAPAAAAPAAEMSVMGEVAPAAAPATAAPAATAAPTAAAPPTATTVGGAESDLVAGPGGGVVKMPWGQLVNVPTYGSYSVATGGVAGTLVSGVAMHPALIVGQSVLAVGSSLYTATVQDQIKSDAVSQIAKALSGLPESSQFRENTIFQALIQTVDDPNKVIDSEDSDKDGDTTERVPFFQVWWAVRSGQIKGLVSQLKSLTQAFITGPMTTFEGTANSTYTPTTVSQVNPVTGEIELVSVPGPLARQEVEGADGAVVELLRALKVAGKGVTFWTPGPTAAELDTWNELDDDTCVACTPPPTYDDVDFAVGTFQDFVEDASTLKEVVSGEVIGTSIDNVVGTWETWMKLFYDPDPESQDDYYDLLGMVVDGGNGLVGMKGWATEIEAIRKGLPGCIQFDSCVEFDESGNCTKTISGIENPPCRDGGTGGSIDGDLADEFTPVQQEIGKLVAAIGPFRSAAQQYHDNMEEVEALLGADQGGTNPVTYAWTDSRGDHSVQAGVGPFKVAYIKKKTSGSFLKKKICLILKDYSDAETGMPATVTITRQDPPNKDIGFWNWNPHGGTITKVSKVSYGFDHVGMSGTK